MMAESDPRSDHRVMTESDSSRVMESDSREIRAADRGWVVLKASEARVISEIREKVSCRIELFCNSGRKGEQSFVLEEDLSSTKF